MRGCARMRNMDTLPREYDIPLSHFHEAASAIQGKVLRSPLVELEPHLYLKAENMQPSGSFKIRGATYCMSRLSPEAKKRGVITYSTGNHAQAVALASQRLQIPATIVMSPDAPLFKIERTKEYGAAVVMTEPSSLIRRTLAEEIAARDNLTLVPPYDHLDILAGQGTIGLEILQEMTPAYVFVPVGGGGLISGIAMAIKKQNPQVVLIGVEPELENDAYQTFQVGHRVRLEKSSSSIADAIKIQELGNITYPIMQAYVDEMVQVSEEEIKQATREILDRGHLFVEPSGALGLAGARAYKVKNRPTVCIVSGGNTLLANLSAII